MAAEVVVVGGGAIGAATALELARRGIEVTLLERGPRVASGCSAGNAGLICPSHAAPLANPAALREGIRSLLKRDSPFYLRPRPGVLPWLLRFAVSSSAVRAKAGTETLRDLSLAGLRLHAELAEQGLDTGFERRGTLSVYETESGFAAASSEALGSQLAAQVLQADEAREFEPALSHAIAGAVYHPEDAHCDPLAFVEAAALAATDAGAAVRTGVEVTRLRRTRGVGSLNHGVEVVTSEGTLRPSTVVLAAGAWTARLARQLGVFLPLEGGKGYHVDLVPASDDPRLPVFAQEARTIATPLRGRLRLSGTLELAGLDLRVNGVRVETIRRSCGRILRSQEGRRVVEVWSGLRPCTPDGLPVIGRPAGVEGLVLATGHAMKGLSLAPVTGRIVAELIAGEPSSHDLSPFSPDRFRPLLRLR